MTRDFPSRNDGRDRDTFNTKKFEDWYRLGCAKMTTGKDRVRVMAVHID